MPKEKFEIKVFKVSLFIFLFGLIIFLALIPISYSLSIGWVAGCFSATLTYLVGILLINKFFRKKRTKTIGFWIGMMRFYISLALQAGLFISIIAIDRSVNGHSFTDGTISDMYSPINLFTYIGGVSLILISTLVAQFLSREGRLNGKS